MTRAVMVMFDTLNRRFLPPYGAEGIHAPNFTRLAERTVRFTNCYAGSMPCMPARREIHTGRYNFLHRSWGPLEPFDDSTPQLLSESGVYTHLVTDHQHYWEDGGATYHNRYDTYELFRGQEGDPWKGHVRDPEMPPKVSRRAGKTVRQDRINRSYYPTEDLHPQTRTVSAGLEFIRTNAAEDSWFLQIECFDPHEPFVSYPRHRRWYREDGVDTGAEFDWPDYARVAEEPAAIEQARDEYRALLTMCDTSLGRVLDAFDELNLWEDTLLIVCTDHGLLLGERGWWGKNVQPWYDENIHTPLFVWDPRTARTGESVDHLVQTVDFGPTLLEYFGIERPSDMQGIPMGPTLAATAPARETGLFGSFGGHVSITDGRYVYMRACATDANEPLFEHTLMPTHMATRFAPEELRDAELVAPFSFTKGVPVLRAPARAGANPADFGTLLFDLLTDPDQRTPLVDDRLERKMATLLVEQLRAADAPSSQYERLGLPETGEVGEAHLLAARQAPRAREAAAALPTRERVARDAPGLLAPLGDLPAEAFDDPVVARRAPMLADPAFRRDHADASVYDLALTHPMITADALEAVGDVVRRTPARA
ncbi:sulfatase [Microbacterium sp. SSW1-59]|uniref:sulfatase n=1 Tax=Microbacterium xanthum TaxID=3079794 RepID=UPI002AD4AA4A|nr:sulfatase [Microbacterium sp. SSW1-59]MDZ8201215.1 sulfatase [Microbacterium sp. SSW1-59]